MADPIDTDAIRRIVASGPRPSYADVRKPEADWCVRCHHRAYDHDTPDGVCWKCDCVRVVRPNTPQERA